MEKLEKEKIEWLEKIGAIDISEYDYIVSDNLHLFSLKYLQNNSLEEIKTKYEILYSNLFKD